MKKIVEMWNRVSLIAKILVGIVIGAVLGLLVPGATGIGLNIDNPLSDTVVNTSPMIPNGAHPMIHLTTVDTASDMDTSADFIDLLVRRMASPNKSAHASMQR